LLERSTSGAQAGTAQDRIPSRKVRRFEVQLDVPPSLITFAGSASRHQYPRWTRRRRANGGPASLVRVSTEVGRLPVSGSG
jgi:hypothetical protein